MSYDPALPTIRDRIRFIIGDTSDDPVFPDETYMSIIAENSNWRLAAAAMADAIAVAIEQDPSGFTATGDMSVSWSDRTRSLRQIAGRLRMEAASEVASISNTIESVQLHRGGTYEAEYRSNRRRRW